MIPRYRPLGADSPSAVATTPAVLVLGCHGGAGATTLTDFLGGQAQEYPARPDDLAGSATGYLWPVILVTRTHAAGTAAAATAIGHLGGVTRGVVLAAVPDLPGREPAVARARLRMMSGHCAVVRLPFVAAWRELDRPEAAPAAYQRAVDRLRSAVDSLVPHSTGGFLARA